jgi:hypothetical protein
MEVFTVALQERNGQKMDEMVGEEVNEITPLLCFTRFICYLTGLLMTAYPGTID